VTSGRLEAPIRRSGAARGAWPTWRPAGAPAGGAAV